jgi:hypothetical protein
MAEIYANFCVFFFVLFLSKTPCQNASVDFMISALYDASCENECVSEVSFFNVRFDGRQCTLRVVPTGPV